MRSTRFRGMILLPTGAVMPGMIGRNLFEQAVAKYPGLKVVLHIRLFDVIAHRGILRK